MIENIAGYIYGGVFFGIVFILFIFYMIDNVISIKKELKKIHELEKKRANNV